ncbi:hydroxymethylbilane synthase [Corynebacterium imitans]|uniref:hydroxymethylbilane synthase n=1 Tax=Corynebacterium imitans TaxID=156978 RepID=UPI001EF2139C|nr:hydroxymethylbilane synthase [Corynebacterium imitans]MCG7278672.1 hydroxymethylbilane synthase [Corynebacterium imitans]
MLKIGTRGSHLATTQAGHVRDALIANGAEAELHIVTTAGDVNMSPVERIGVGVFTTALRAALASGEVDVAVHSFKDLPTAPDTRLHLVTPEREDHRDALIARDGLTFEQLPQGAKVGTSAPRRVSQLRAMRPDLDIRPLRGNIETRMSYVQRGELDAIILAYAGLSRGGYADRATEVFDPDTLVPAPAQGALAVECRADDADNVRALDALIDEEATVCAAAERQVLTTLQAGCTAPVAAYATRAENGELTLRTGVFALDGKTQLVETVTGTDAIEVGTRAAKALLARGARALME